MQPEKRSEKRSDLALKGMIQHGGLVAWSCIILLFPLQCTPLLQRLLFHHVCPSLAVKRSEIRRKNECKQLAIPGGRDFQPKAIARLGEEMEFSKTLPFFPQSLSFSSSEKILKLLKSSASTASCDRVPLT